jgi:hypothetical protein
LSALCDGRSTVPPCQGARDSRKEFDLAVNDVSFFGNAQAYPAMNFGDAVSSPRKINPYATKPCESIASAQPTIR